MPTEKPRIHVTLEGDEPNWLETLANEEGVTKPRMIGLLIRRAWKQRERELKKNTQAYATYKGE